MPWTSDFEINTTTKTVHINTRTAEATNAAIAKALGDAHQAAIFAHLKKWRGESFRVIGAREDIYVERAGADLLGTTASCMHLNIFVRNAHTHAVSVWMQKRSMAVKKYPGMLDNCVAGGITRGYGIAETLLKESQEEAGVSPDFVRRHAKAVGTVTFTHTPDAERTLIDNTINHVYDMEVGADFRPQPADGEAESFSLLNISELQTAIAEGKCKPACAMVSIDFLIRHGVLTDENTMGYVELNARLHRRLPCATTSDM